MVGFWNKQITVRHCVSVLCCEGRVQFACEGGIHHNIAEKIKEKQFQSGVVCEEGVNFSQVSDCSSLCNAK